MIKKVLRNIISKFVPYRSIVNRQLCCKGYIAITSALIISALLVVIVATISLSAFLSRGNISTTHFKEKSRTLSEGCAQTALLKFVQNSSTYSGGETVTIASDTCQVVSVVASGTTQKVISTTAHYQDAYTNYKVIMNISDFSIADWEEVSHF